MDWFSRMSSVGNLGNVGLQIMTDVSKKRLSFIHLGVDIFEPFVVKEQNWSAMEQCLFVW